MRILTMSGFVPEQICDTIRFTGYTGERNISQYCGYASDYISQVNMDDSIDGAVFPKSCDSSRIVKSYLKNMDKFIYQLSVPSRQDCLAIEYYAKEIEQYKKAVESYYQIQIQDIPKRIQAVEVRNQKIRNIYEELDQISYGAYLESVHKMLKQPLLKQHIEQNYDKMNFAGKRVYLVGSFLANVAITNVIESCGMNIVGDNLPESGRCITQGVDDEKNLYLTISKMILSRKLSPTQNNFRQLLNEDIDEIKRKSVQGVIYIAQKYCEPYDYLYSIYKKKLDEMKIPIIKLNLTHSEDDTNVQLVLEAFADIL